MTQDIFGFESFKKKDGYMSFTGKKVEICLEPCLNGCDVAVYDLNMDLLEPKYCTNLNLQYMEVIDQVIKIREAALIKAKEFYLKYEK